MKISLKNICIFIAFFCINSIQAQQIQNVKLQLKWKHQFQFAGYYAAIEKGYYKDIGIQVNLIEAVEGINPSDEVFNGNAEFGICSSDILLMRSQQKKAVVLAAVFQHSPLVLLASKESGIKNVHGLIGKRIAIEPNAADILVYMNDEGVSMDKCIIKQHLFNTEKLLNGKIDAITAYSTDEPFVLEKANFDYTIISPLAGGIDFYGEVLFTTDSLIKTNPELVNNFREASLKGWKYAMNNQQEIIKLIYDKYSKRHSLEHLQFEAEHMESLIMSDVVEIGYSNLGRWKFILDTYKKLNLLDGSYTIDGLLYSDYLKPKTNIPWKLIAIFILIILIIGLLALFFYSLSKKLKNEIKNRFSAEMQIRKLSIAVEQSPTTIVVTDTKGNIEYVNPKFVELTGYTSQEVKGKNTRILSSGKTDSKIIKELWKTIASGKTWQGEFINKKKNGEEFIENARIAPIFNEIGTIINYIAIKEDITKRRQTEIALKRNEEKFRGITETSPDAIIIVSLEGIIQYISPHVLTMWGYELEHEIIGKNITEFFDSSYHDKVNCQITEVLKGNFAKSTECLMIRKDGSNFFGEANANFLYNHNNEPNSILLIQRNITNRKNTELKLLEQKQELQELNATKDKLFSIIGHDLRGPIGGLKSFLEFLISSEDLSDTKKLKTILQLLSDSANATFELLENLLSWANSQQNETIFAPEKLELKAVYNLTIQLFIELTKKKQIKVIDNIPDGIFVFADRNMLMLVFRNLISNAIKFTPSGKQIQIFAENKLLSILLQLKTKVLELIPKIYRNFLKILKLLLLMERMANREQV